MNTLLSPNRERKSAPAKIEKAPTTRKGLIKKKYMNYNVIPTEYHGRFNRIATEKEIANCWWSCIEFFKEREKYHQESAAWYFDHARAMEANAGEHLDLADVSRANYLHYLDLLHMAALKRIEGVDYAR